MKKIFLSILFSLLTLNPLLCMPSGNNATAEETTTSQDSSDPSAEDLKSVAQQLNKQIEALTKAAQEVDQNSEPTQIAKIQEKISALSKISEKLSPVPGKIASAFEWLSARLDTILTVKGAIKTTLMLGIIFAIFHRFLPSEFLKTVVEAPVNATVNGATAISNAVMTGVLSGTEKALDNQELINKVVAKVAEIQAGAQINAEYAKTTAPLSSWSLFGQSAALAASSGAGVGIIILFKTIIEGLGKKLIGAR